MRLSCQRSCSRPPQQSTNSVCRHSAEECWIPIPTKCYERLSTYTYPPNATMSIVFSAGKAAAVV
jgi:hypothetical protein